MNNIFHYWSSLDLFCWLSRLNLRSKVWGSFVDSTDNWRFIKVIFMKGSFRFKIFLSSERKWFKFMVKSCSFAILIDSKIELIHWQSHCLRCFWIWSKRSKNFVAMFIKFSSIFSWWREESLRKWLSTSSYDDSFVDCGIH